MPPYAKRTFFVYIMASKSGVLYTGVTNDLERRVAEHKDGSLPGFTKRYHVTRLVYFEQFGRADEAITREKQIKAWSRKKKLALVQTLNPKWRDLTEA
jgi:putative endonuclease